MSILLFALVSGLVFAMVVVADMLSLIFIFSIERWFFASKPSLLSVARDMNSYRFSIGLYFLLSIVNLWFVFWSVMALSKILAYGRLPGRKISRPLTGPSRGIFFRRGNAVQPEA